MAYSCDTIAEPVAPRDLKTEAIDNMRPQGQQISDRLTVEVDCHSLGPNDCPSMTSSFSPLESPTPTPTSLYSQNSMASPSWHEAGHYHSLPMERRTSATPLRNAFRMTDLASGEAMGLPCGNIERQDQMAIPDYLPGYDENVEQFWIPQDTIPKTYEQPTFPYQAPMQQYNTMGRNHYYRAQPAPYLPESASNPCLSRPIFNQPERLSNSVSMTNMLHWMPSTESLTQTIAPSQAFPAGPQTPPSSSYSEFPTHIQNFKAHTPSTPVRSVSLGTPSGADTPGSRVSGHNEYHDEFPVSPVYRDGMMRAHRQVSRKSSKKQLVRSALNLDNLPPVIKQVQFKCKEPGCKGRFKRQEHLKRHMKSHSKEKPHVCWVPGCHRAFSRSDNLNAHYTKTHSKRGGRNRYVATLDESSPDYDPDFRGQLTADGRPIIGSKLEDPIDCGDFSVDGWDD
ncbi:hypothetical protein N7462_006120 [Penicillium macrosclerotiorum]|uniref:uncharacterized protein n=1 Tax=Penicillium macrosclerotiorum TaxID=303699 RepID=UPI002547B5E4|nr:uncharacterized protein N7462_006120 [Penicillium macrosclerotiorum]KAJ5682955.1 hypothetical protein N7462_006120 [Penicillium macrosclerotiorum]